MDGFPFLSFAVVNNNTCWGRQQKYPFLVKKKKTKNRKKNLIANSFDPLNSIKRR